MKIVIDLVPFCQTRGEVWRVQKLGTSKGAIYIDFVNVRFAVRKKRKTRYDMTFSATLSAECSTLNHAHECVSFSQFMMAFFWIRISHQPRHITRFLWVKLSSNYPVLLPPHQRPSGWFWAGESILRIPLNFSSRHWKYSTGSLISVRYGPTHDLKAPSRYGHGRDCRFLQTFFACKCRAVACLLDWWKPGVRCRESSMETSLLSFTNSPSIYRTPATASVRELSKLW